MFGNRRLQTHPKTMTWIFLEDDEDVESFSGSHADLEGAADNLFASPPHPQPLRSACMVLFIAVKIPTKQG